MTVVCTWKKWRMVDKENREQCNWKATFCVCHCEGVILWMKTWGYKQHGVNACGWGWVLGFMFNFLTIFSIHSVYQQIMI